VKGFGHKLFAGARLAKNEHRCLGGGEAGNEPEKVLHGRRRADDGAHTSRTKLTVEPVVSLAESLEARGVEHLEHEGVVGHERLGEKAKGPGSHGRNGGRNVCEGGHDHHLAPVTFLSNVLQELIARHVGHVHICQHDVERPGTELAHGDQAVVRLGNIETAGSKQAHDRGTNAVVVVDHQHGHSLSVEDRRRGTRAVVECGLQKDPRGLRRLGRPRCILASQVLLETPHRADVQLRDPSFAHSH
jgi:hypothetical protein